jgi:hypothetical protein
VRDSGTPLISGITPDETLPYPHRAGNYANGAQYVGILFLTFWILLSYLVPLSLFVTMEIVKFVLARARAPPPTPRPRGGCRRGTEHTLLIAVPKMHGAPPSRLKSFLQTDGSRRCRWRCRRSGTGLADSR